MARVTLDQDGRILLPSTLRRRLGLEAGEELLIAEADAGLVLHTLRPTVRKVCLELTTRCNLHCRACVRHVWDDPQSDMSAEEYVRFRAAVRGFHMPSCVDCDLRDTCDLTEANEACWGPNPSCADCLWAQDIIRCP